MDSIKCDFCLREYTASGLLTGHSGTICERCIRLCHELVIGNNQKITEQENINAVTPVYLKNQLDCFVIGQEKAKKVLSVAVYNHYKRLKTLNNINSDITISKNNILLIGPTGCGKTFLAETLAKSLDVPFGHADATTLTEAGYVGDDVEKVLYSLLKNSKMDVSKAERGIVYIDEIDKISQKASTSTKDVSGGGVQRGLLKILEGTVASVPMDGKRHETIQLNTNNILFICGGAFDGLDQLLQRRLQPSSIGFAADIKSHKEITKEKDRLREKVAPEDLISYGFMPEFIGRLSVIVTINNLTVDDLCDILIKPKNCLIKQYQELFKLDGIALEFTEKALEAIAALAIKRKTGARGLKAILETLLLDLMFDAPDSENKKFTIDEDSVKLTCGG